MSDRWSRLTAEVGRFATSGTIASVVAFVLFNWLVHWEFGVGAGGWLNDHAITGFVIANTFSTVVTYYLSRWWAFRHREPVGALGGSVTFFAISVASLIIPVICLWISRNLLDLTTALADNIAANVVGLFLGFVARFFAFRTFVFQRREPGVEARADAAAVAAVAAAGDESPGAESDRAGDGVDDGEEPAYPRNSQV